MPGHALAASHHGSMSADCVLVSAPLQPGW